MEELTGKADEKSASLKVFTSALAFVAGFSTVFVILGASASFLGQFVTQYIEVLGYIAGVLIIIMGLHFLGVFRIGLLYREARVHVERKPAGLIGAYLIGLAFAFGWTPCVGPILSAILFVAGSEATVGRGRHLAQRLCARSRHSLPAGRGIRRPVHHAMSKFRRYMGIVEKVMAAFSS